MNQIFTKFTATARLFVLILALITLATMVRASAGPLQEKYDSVKNQYDIARYQWYDMYAQGVMVKAGDAGKMIERAKTLMEQNQPSQAATLLDKAEGLLKVYDKSVLPEYNATNNLGNYDLSRLRKSTIEDYKARSMYDILKGDIGIGFAGRGSDGKYYEIMPLINYHGTGGIIPPVAFEIICSDEYGKPHMVLIDKQPEIILQTDQSIVYYAEDNGNYMLYSVSKIGEHTVVWIEGKGRDLYGEDVAFNVAMQSDYTYWYNQNRSGYAIYPSPGTSFAGFEELGPAEGTITMNGKTANFVSAFGESENLFNGPQAGSDINKIIYRTMMTIYGNEWWFPFKTDQLYGFMCIIGNSRDFAIFYKGENLVPTEVKITPLAANKSFLIDAKTSKGDLHLRVDCTTFETFYFEYGGTVTGTFNGIKLTNGYGMLEHTPIGGLSGCPTIDAMGAGKLDPHKVMDNLLSNFPPPVLGEEKIGQK